MLTVPSNSTRPPFGKERPMARKWWTLTTVVLGVFMLLLDITILYVIGTGVFTAGSLLCGLATGPLFLSLARAGQGVGGAIMFATSLALLSDAFRGRDRGVAFGGFGAVTGIAVAIGPVVGGAITTGLSWRWIFLVNIPIGVVTLGITLARVGESRDPRATRP